VTKKNRASQVAAAKPGGNDPTCDRAISPGNTACQRQNQLTGLVHKVALFETRCFDMAKRVDAGEVIFQWGIDCVYDSAVSSGLVDEVGYDVVQSIMAHCFMEVRR
jgi:hypothetical protein